MGKALQVVRGIWALAWAASAFVVLAYVLPRGSFPCTFPGPGGGGGHVPDVLHRGAETLDILCMGPVVPLWLIGLVSAGFAYVLWRLLSPMVTGDPSSPGVAWAWVIVAGIAGGALILSLAFGVTPGWESYLLGVPLALVAGSLLGGAFPLVFRAPTRSAPSVAVISTGT